MGKAERDRIESCRRSAAKFFKDHVLTVRLDQGLYRNWRMARGDGSGIDAVNISTEPGRLIVTGDHGALVLERCPDMIPWAASSIHSIHYFAEKACREINVREFDPEVAREWVASEREPDGDDPPPMGEELADQLLSALEDGEPFFTHALHESGHVDGCDWPDFENFTHRFLMQREAILWLLARLPDEVTGRGTGEKPPR